MNITIYSTTSCGFCRMLKKYLEDHDFSYTEKLADTDESLAYELFEKSHQFAVPFTVIEKDNGTSESILGFDIPKFNAVLGIA